MHRIDVPSATVDHKFTEGSPAGGVPATTVSADWLNDLQENIMAVLAAAGIAPVKGLATQLRDSIQQITLALASQAEVNAGTVTNKAVSPKTLANGSTYSLGTNGYIILPTWLGSLCIQWGSTPSIPAAGNQTISFPVAFQNNVFAAYLTYANSASDVAGGSTYIGQVRSLLSTQVVVRNLGPLPAQYYWLAIGF